MMSGSGEGKSGGKERISSALLGLLLALGSYIILSTINRDLLNLDFTIKPLGVEGTPTTGVDLSKSTVTNPPAQDPYTIGTDGTVYYNGAPTDYYSENGIIYDMEGGQPVNNPGYTVDPKTAAAVKPGQGNQSAINAALQAFQQYGTQASNQRYIGIMDYTQPSSAERFYILDRQTGQITSTKAAHGSGSDPNNTGIATQFSNVSDSKKSSLGAFIAKPYYSTSMNKNALQLNGLESINSNAADRGLAIHNSNYVSDDQCGRSSGCIAYPPGLQNQIQTQLSNAFVYSYGGQQ